MIPRDYITEWRQKTAWTEDAQVEQDLIICRALIDMFSHHEVTYMLAFRGGTAQFTSVSCMSLGSIDVLE